MYLLQIYSIHTRTFAKYQNLIEWEEIKADIVTTSYKDLEKSQKCCTWKL